MLARYSDSHGRLREVLAKPGSGGSVLVIDRDVLTRGEERLVAHLAADEPRINAAVACSDYLNQSVRRCRLLTPEDLWVAPFAEERRPASGRSGGEIGGDGEARRGDGDAVGTRGSAVGGGGVIRSGRGGRARDDAGEDPRGEVCDSHGNVYRLDLAAEGIAVPDLRWHLLPTGGAPEQSRTVSLRDVVAALESYQPVCALTARALAEHHEDARVATVTLRHELERLRRSPIVLNRKLRGAVLAVIEAQEISLSEITIRCGRYKRDERGRVQGDTSWLARRIGLRPESGRSVPTPWVHSDVLALIAREGLGISPREVEVA
jgi:hypothetical protein